MSENNGKQPNTDDREQVDYQWEVLKMGNRMVDLLKLVEENAVKIRSNSARISRVQATIKRVKDEEEGWEPEGGEEVHQMEPQPFDLHGMDYEQLEEALNKVTLRL